MNRIIDRMGEEGLGVLRQEMPGLRSICEKLADVLCYVEGAQERLYPYLLIYG